MATKKKARKKAIKKKAAKKVNTPENPVVTQQRLNPIREDLKVAAQALESAMTKANELKLGDREDTKRVFQQINNALVRCDAALEEL